MGYVIVEFPERREVLVDDVSQGDNRDDAGNYRILRIADGLHTFRLAGADDYVPAFQNRRVADTTAVNPLRVVFAKKSGVV